MPAQPRYRAPAGNGEVLAVPGFDAIPALVEENRRKLDRDDILIGGLALRELRKQSRREVLEAASGYSSELANPERKRGGNVDPLACARGSPEAPLLLAGHQPELAHPGVWVKNFALNGLARKLGGITLHLIVDNDTLRSTAIQFPVIQSRGPGSVHLHSVPFDRLDGETYEYRSVFDPELFRTFLDRAAPLWRNWGYEPALCWAWEYVTRFGDLQPNIGELFSAVRRRFEQGWGCRNLEVPVSRLAATDAFARFASDILGDLSRFRDVYNAALCAYREANGIRNDNHPAPDLAEGEAPFWVRTTLSRRERATAASDPRSLRPRALTLTLFARVCLGDFFIHGIGGGKYDEVTDAIIRDYFGLDPPAYQVLSATLHMPLPAFPATEADVKRLERELRELTWNPQRHLSPEALARPEVRQLVEEKQSLAAKEPPRGEHAARRDWFRRFHQVTGQLQPLMADRAAEVESQLDRARAESRANAILKRRDYSWVLYPEKTLRPFLQQFLDL
jgi:hypothetical protein